MSVSVIMYVAVMTVDDITPLVVVTGPSRGLGKDLVLALAKRRCRLLLLGRDTVAIDAVAKDALKAGATSVHVVGLDLTSFASIRSCASELAALVAEQNLGAIHAVVANAGIQMSNRLQKTADGLETTFGVNVVGNHLLLKLLRPLLAPDAHVVVVGSGTHFGDPVTRVLVAAPIWQEPAQLAAPGGTGGETTRAGQCAYSTSKLGVNYFVHELNRQWGAPIRANVYDPGLMPGTGLARDLPPVKRWVWNNIMPALTILPGVATTAHSAERLARLTLGEEHAGVSNAYIELGKLSEASKASNDPAREASLWNYCNEVTKTSETS
jgi:NAD(P)-dependent dehydrogenase (short-subunit alcohol dehydrogenase family)